MLVANRLKQTADKRRSVSCEDGTIGQLGKGLILFLASDLHTYHFNADLQERRASPIVITATKRGMFTGEPKDSGLLPIPIPSMVATGCLYEASVACCALTFGSRMSELANPAPKLATVPMNKRRPIQFPVDSSKVLGSGIQQCSSIGLKTLSANQIASPWEEGHWK